MISIIICTHSPLASSLKSTAEMIFGKTERISCLELSEGGDMIVFSTKIKAQYKQDLEEGYQPIIMVDIPNASPFNASILALAEYKEARILTGINLPLLLQVLVQQTYGDYDTFDFEHLVVRTRESIQVVQVKDFLESE